MGFYRGTDRGIDRHPWQDPPVLRQTLQEEFLRQEGEALVQAQAAELHRAKWYDAPVRTQANPKEAAEAAFEASCIEEAKIKQRRANLKALYDRDWQEWREQLRARGLAFAE